MIGKRREILNDWRAKLQNPKHVTHSNLLVLGIETSCDETGIALYCEQDGLLAHALYSQVAVHARYGGVVPELASRDHIRKTLPLIETMLSDANIDLQALNGIAYTRGPGLVGALLAGASIAHSLAYALNIASIGIHHMEGHLLAPMLEPTAPKPPFLALLVSGGHTLLVRVDDIGRYQVLGDTLDDAAGEAFDKTAKLLGLPYPGGAALAELAKLGDPGRFSFPRPMTDRPGLEFSFSGLKTSAINTLAKTAQSESDRADIAAGFQAAIVDTLVIKSRRALKASGLNRLVVAGGVGANRCLRRQLAALATEIGAEVFYPRFEFCTDNGAMIAYAGLLRLRAGHTEGLAFDARPRWSLETLTGL